MPTTSRLTIPCVSQRFWVAKIKATCVTFAKHPVLKSLILLSILFSPPVLQWPQIFFFPLPSDQTGAVLFGADFLASIFWRLVFLLPIEIETGYMD